MTRHLIRATLLTTLLCAGAAAAQTGVPVTITNDETAPLPVFNAGRIPYQFTAGVDANPGQEACKKVRVPEGMTLTIKSVQLESTVETGKLPSAYLITTRKSGGGGSYYRTTGPLTLTYASSATRIYRGLLELELLAGPTGSPVEYTASLCTKGDGSYASARFVVTGYVEPTVILDGNALPDPDAPPSGPQITIQPHVPGPLVVR